MGRESRNTGLPRKTRKSTKVETLLPQSSQRTQRKDKYSLTMKNMKVMKVNLGTPLSAAALLISPLATNASPLDHARRAAGGEL